MKPLILVVDHDAQVCRIAREYLEKARYRVEVASDAEAHFLDRTPQPCLVVAGISVLIQADGFFAHHAPESSQHRPPWLVLLDNALAEHRMIALDYGADDCIVKPFSARELVKGVRALLRRSAQTTDKADIVIDSWAMRLLVGGSEVPATTLEFKLLEYLARHPGQVFTRDFLLDAVWGDVRFVNPRSVDACIRRIREKIETNSANPTMLKTVRGVGYRMDATAIWQSAPTEICDCPACRTRVSALRLQQSGFRHRRTSVQS